MKLLLKCCYEVFLHIFHDALLEFGGGLLWLDVIPAAV